MALNVHYILPWTHLPHAKHMNRRGLQHRIERQQPDRFTWYCTTVWCTLVTREDICDDALMFSWSNHKENISTAPPFPNSRSWLFFSIVWCMHSKWYINSKKTKGCLFDAITQVSQYLTPYLQNKGPISYMYHIDYRHIDLLRSFVIRPHHSQFQALNSFCIHCTMSPILQPHSRWCEVPIIEERDQVFADHQCDIAFRLVLKSFSDPLNVQY